MDAGDGDVFDKDDVEGELWGVGVSMSMECASAHFFDGTGCETDDDGAAFPSDTFE